MTAPRRSTPARVASFARSGIGLLIIAVAAAWLVEIVDHGLLEDRLQRHGIGPRDADGLEGIIWAPFLHASYGHLASNTTPLLVMGGLIAARGNDYWARLTVTVMLGGGLAVWLIGGSGNHIGASGVVFGYFGALLGAAWFERRPAALGGALLAIMLYSGSLAGLVPQDQLSWESHVCGFVVGVAAARAMAEPRPRRAGDPEGYEPYSWELDEPWND